MPGYEGVPTEGEYAEIQRLRQELSSGILFLMFGESKAMVGQATERHCGLVSEQMLEARICGIDARLPWSAVTAYAASPSVILLLIGQVCLPICRSFVGGEEQWQGTRAIVETHVAAVPARVSTATTPWRVLVLWLALLVVILLAWHFAQMPSTR
jgi:hypothetical protein